MDYTTNLKIKDWAVEDRPREKMVSKGADSLSDAELVALLIGSGSREETAVELAKRILNSVDNNLNELGKLNLEDLKEFNGVGEAKAISIAGALELGKRRKLAEVIHRQKISSSIDVFERFAPKLQDLTHEEFWVVYLNRANKVIFENRISKGGVAGTVIDVKIILKAALERKIASSLILCHNHPSGNINPSKADIQITNKLKDAAKLLDLQVLDHLIIGEDNYFSFADEGYL
ncbi:MAG: DNA repair protein RadC [Bacteroidales bacterium]